MSASVERRLKNQSNRGETKSVPLTIRTKLSCPHHFRVKSSERNRARTSLPANAIAWALFLVLTCALGPVFAQKSNILSEGIDFHRKGDLRQAIESYSEEIKKNPKSADAYNLRGLAYDDMGKLKEAEADFTAAIKIAPTFADAFNNRGEVHRRQGDNRKALADYRMAIKHDKKFADPHYNSALAYESADNNEKAVEFYKSYLRLKPRAKDKNRITAKIEQLGKESPQKKPGSRRVTRQPRTGAQPVRPVGARQAQITPKPGKPAIPGMPAGMGPNEMLGQFVSPEQLQQWQGVITGLGVLGSIIPLAIGILFCVMLFLIARKTRTPLAWFAFIPILQYFLMLNIARKPMWWFILFLLPLALIALPIIGPMDPTGGYLPMVIAAIVLLIPLIAWLMICIGMARMRGKSPIWGVLCWIPCTSIFGFLYLGLSK